MNRFLALWIAIAAISGASAADELGVRLGRSEYGKHCAICHGSDGRGNGPYALYIKAVPSDLTRLAERNGGRFPFNRIYRIIDGRTEIRDHGPREMPVWGWEYNRLARRDADVMDGMIDPEVFVSGRILGLIRYLQTIQTE